jgi:hypothetical protein
VDWDGDPFPLTRTNVIRNAPGASGVYGLRNAEQWVYIGQSPNIYRSLLEYRAGRMPRVLESQPNMFVFELCPPSSRSKRQRELAQRYHPICNKNIGGK